MAKIKICDVMMGAGKTMSAIKMMNRDDERRFIFITPFLDEVKRVKQECADRKFVTPFFNRKKNKFESLKDFMADKRNIVSTHALFKKYDDYTIALIKEGRYTLVMDEVSDVIEPVSVGEYSLQLMLQWGVITVDDHDRVYWQDENYPMNDVWSDCMRTIKTGHVIMHNGKLMLWLFPVEVFGAFEEVIVMTHVFDAQLQKYYYDLNKIEYEYIGVNEQYEFCSVAEMNRDYSWLRDKVHILEDKKLNAVGDNQYALSVSWFGRESDKRGSPNIARIKANAENVVRQRWGSSSRETLWATFKDYKKALSGRSYTRSFLEYNARATNEYRDRRYLMYFVNVFFHVDIKNYFLSHEVQVQEEQYALSVMIQWLWRSQIRDGKPIWVYIPSSRMRKLLQDWLTVQ